MNNFYRAYSGAKFAREAKANPTQWVILPHDGGYKLIQAAVWAVL